MGDFRESPLQDRISTPPYLQDDETGSTADRMRSRREWASLLREIDVLRFPVTS